DAGTPGLADPGYHLVRGALAAGIAVVPVPGPSAPTALVSVAGFPAERLVFEAARRLAAFLAAAEAALGDRQAALARELTKRHEEILRGTLSDLRERVARRASLRGEVTVLVAGAAEAEPAHDVASIDEELRAGRAAGRGLRELAAEIARRTGMSRREVYRRGLALERG